MINLVSHLYSYIFKMHWSLATTYKAIIYIQIFIPIGFKNVYEFTPFDIFMSENSFEKLHKRRARLKSSKL